MRHHLRHRLPSPSRVLDTPGLRWLRPWLDHPALWGLQRRRVAMGFAVGMFSGLMPGPTQMLTAGVLALLLRVNLPVALLTTLYTNPFPYLPLYYLAYRYGCLLLGQDTGSTMSLSSLSQPGHWRVHEVLAWLEGLGWPLLVGVLALGLTLALAGYALVAVSWRCAVGRAWRKRKESRGADGTYPAE